MVNIDASLARDLNNAVLIQPARGLHQPVELARAIGVTGTPTFIIGDAMLLEPHPLSHSLTQCLRLLDQSCDYAGDRIEHAPDIVGGARLTLEFGHDNLEQLISELGGAVGVEHVASEEFVL